ncbi:trypsin-like peptidase domain-containing protein [bacterium 210820-DFI.6.37]|nr:trypsin-like peptidase domain-containing protein [bacterium 210820-DFI.6.37]
MDNFDNNQYQYTSGPNPGQFQPEKNLITTPAEPSGQDPFSGGSGGGRSKKQRKKSKPIQLTRTSLAAIIVVCLFLSSAFGFGGAMLASDRLGSGYSAGQSNTTNADTTGFNLEDATGSAMTVQEITAKTQDSVVEIKTESVQADAWMQQYVTEGAGSGVIIKSNGYIITNNHVIDGASKITVTTSDEKEYEATLVGTDSDTDVAVLKINAKNLTAATFGNSDQLNVGDLAVAIGNPLGELGGTVTAGIISALDRSISIDGKTMSLLQTDTSINPGNSGGGLFNQYGQLVGVVVAKSSGSDVEGLGFAIPINRAAEVASQLMDGGYVKGKPYTGMAYVDMSQQQSSQGGIDSFFSSGNQQSMGSVYIQEVTGTNAKKAGFKAGDLVYSVDGKEIDSFETLSSIITSHKVGDTVTYIVLRDGQSKEIKLTLEEKTSSN